MILFFTKELINLFRFLLIPVHKDVVAIIIFLISQFDTHCMTVVEKTSWLVTGQGTNGGYTI